MKIRITACPRPGSLAPHCAALWENIVIDALDFRETGPLPVQRGFFVAIQKLYPILIERAQAQGLSHPFADDLELSTTLSQANQILLIFIPTDCCEVVTN